MQCSDDLLRSLLMCYAKRIAAGGVQAGSCRARAPAVVHTVPLMHDTRSGRDSLIAASPSLRIDASGTNPFEQRVRSKAESGTRPQSRLSATGLDGSDRDRTFICCFVAEDVSIINLSLFNCTAHFLWFEPMIELFLRIGSIQRAVDSTCRIP